MLAAAGSKRILKRSITKQKNIANQLHYFLFILVGGGEGVKD